MLQLTHYRVSGSSLKVSPSLNIETEAMDGDTSISSRKLKGIKPKRLAVSLQLRFDQANELGELTRIAEAVTPENTLVIYDLVNRAGNAMGIKQVQFTDSFTVTEVDGKRAWRVAFTLIEVGSVPEKTEERQGVAQSSATGEPIAFGETEQTDNFSNGLVFDAQARGELDSQQIASTVPYENSPRNGFERVLAGLNKQLGGEIV